MKSSLAWMKSSVAWMNSALRDDFGHHHSIIHAALKAYKRRPRLTTLAARTHALRKELARTIHPVTRIRNHSISNAIPKNGSVRLMGPTYTGSSAHFLPHIPGTHGAFDASIWGHVRKKCLRFWDVFYSRSVCPMGPVFAEPCKNHNRTPYYTILRVFNPRIETFQNREHFSQKKRITLYPGKRPEQ